MVRSHWIGSVFGVLALTSLAWGQATPPVAAGTSAEKDRYVTVQEAGKPAQRCKVLKTWTEPNGGPAFQAQALDTGELMTVVEAGPASPRPAAQARPVSMHIFHWGWNAPVPVGTPEPPSNAVVVGYPIDIRPPQPEPSRIAAGPAPSPKPQTCWPSPFAQINGADLKVSDEHLAPPVIAPMAQAAPPAKKVELAPIAPSPVVANPVQPAPASSYAAKSTVGTVVKSDAHPFAVTTWVPWPTTGETPASVVKPTPAVAAAAPPPAPLAWTPTKSETKPAPAVAAAPSSLAWTPTKTEVKPAPASTVAKASDVKTSADATVWKPSAAATPPAPPKAPVVAKKVETTVPAPSDWRQSWSKVDAPLPPPGPAIPEPQAVAAPSKVGLPHAAPLADDPLKAPDKFAKIPQTGGFTSETPAPEKKAPLLAALALDQPPAAPRPAGKEPPAHAGLTPPPPPAHPAPPAAVAKSTLTLAPIAPPAPAESKPAAAAKPDAAPPTPAVPLGLGSVLAAASPELASKAEPAPQAAAPMKTEVGVRADEPNAFTDRPKDGAVALAPNAFSAPAPSAPPPDVMAMNAFPPPQQAAPYYAPAAVAIRTPPRPAAAAPQMPVGYVVPAEYHQENGCDLSQVTAILRDSLYPSQREWAAETLASMDWRQRPEVVDILVERAKQDPAPTVRADCVRSLGRMKADAPAAVEAVRALRADPDARVRQEADEAYGVLTGSAPAH